MMIMTMMMMMMMMVMMVVTICVISKDKRFETKLRQLISTGVHKIRTKRRKTSIIEKPTN